MIKSAFAILGAAAVTGIALAPGAASAAPATPPVLANSSTPSGSDPATTVTFTVTTGALAMTVPTNVDLGSGAPGSTISNVLGAVGVTDNRALLTASWTATASSTAWTTGGSTSPESIPAGDVTYNPGSITTTGTITATGTSITLAGTTTPVVTATAGVGDNAATWDPTISVAVPAAAVGGAYTGTLTQSVS